MEKFEDFNFDDFADFDALKSDSGEESCSNEFPLDFRNIQEEN